MRVRKIRTRVLGCRPSMAAPEGVVVLEVVGVGAVRRYESGIVSTTSRKAHRGRTRDRVHSCRRRSALIRSG